MSIVIKNSVLGYLSPMKVTFRPKPLILRSLSFTVERSNLSDNHSAVREHAESILKQKIDVLNTISCTDYTRRANGSSSVGAHMRHSLDHFNCVLGKHNLQENATLDYDARNRDTDIERLRTAALSNCEELIAQLHSLQSDRPVTVKFISDPLNETSYELQSSVYREIAFVTHHAVHHLSSIKNIVETFGYEIKDRNIGVASSTQIFEKKMVDQEEKNIL